LPLGQDVLDSQEGHLVEIPFECFAAIEIHMLKLEDHAQLTAIHIGVFFSFLDGDSRSLADCDRIIVGKHFTPHFLQVIVDFRTIGYIRLGIAITVRPDDTIRKIGVLGNQADDIHAEAVYTSIQPPAHHGVDGLSHLGTFPVEIRLVRGKEVEIIIASCLIERPGGSTKPGTPIVGGAAFVTRFPDIEITFG